MKLHVIARGKIGRCPEADIIARYMARIRWPLTITELPEAIGAPSTPLSPHRTIALDEVGQSLSSEDLATQLGLWRDAGVRECRFLIGAANGLTDVERSSADLMLSFGRATFPHMLVRVMLIEQLYRAITILDGHPYHRSG